MDIEDALKELKNILLKNNNLIIENSLNIITDSFLKKRIFVDCKKIELNIIPIQTFNGIEYILDLKIFTETGCTSTAIQKTSDEIINIAKLLKMKAFW